MRRVWEAWLPVTSPSWEYAREPGREMFPWTTPTVRAPASWALGKSMARGATHTAAAPASMAGRHHHRSRPAPANEKARRTRTATAMTAKDTRATPP